jgi:hypothetical protein
MNFMNHEVKLITGTILLAYKLSGTGLCFHKTVEFAYLLFEFIIYLIETFLRIINILVLHLIPKNFI